MFLYVIEKHRKRSYIDLLFCQSVFCHVYNMHTCVNINTGLDEQIPVLPLIRVNDNLKHSSFDNLLCSFFNFFSLPMFFLFPCERMDYIPGLSFNQCQPQRPISLNTYDVILIVGIFLSNTFCLLVF